MNKSRSSAGCHVATEPVGRVLLAKKNQTVIDNDDLRLLVAKANTLYACQDPRGLCPKCKKYVLIEGWRCFGCGYDKDDEEETDG